MKREAPITPAMLKLIKKKAKSSRDSFIVSLLIGAFFFAMKSCKYIATSREPRIQIITSDCFNFFWCSKDRNTLVKFNNSSTNAMQIIFKMQKNLETNKLISNYSTTSSLCSIKA